MMQQIVFKSRYIMEKVASYQNHSLNPQDWWEKEKYFWQALVYKEIR